MHGVETKVTIANALNDMDVNALNIKPRYPKTEDI